MLLFMFLMKYHTGNSKNYPNFGSKIMLALYLWVRIDYAITTVKFYKSGRKNCSNITSFYSSWTSDWISTSESLFYSNLHCSQYYFWDIPHSLNRTNCYLLQWSQYIWHSVGQSVLVWKVHMKSESESESQAIQMIPNIQTEYFGSLNMD